MKTTKALFASLALGTAAVMLSPEPSQGFALLGHQLNLNTRDFRVFNNFNDGSANNNTTPHVDYPGATGAVMAIWKACVEWGSAPHGTGTGDSTQSIIGSGTSNFEPTYQGLASSAANNTHAALSGGDGSVFAFMTGGGGGWSCRYYEVYTWADGPGFISGSQADLQGIAAHEFGHALGLDHGSGSSTMSAGTWTGNTNERSINNDDRNGLIAIYGAKSASKPEITGLSVSPDGTQITITGFNFTPTDNEVWLTNQSLFANGDPLKVTGLASTGGGTQITATLPTGSGQGDVLVKTSNPGATSLSNAWPNPAAGPLPTGPALTAINPPQLQALTATNALQVQLLGSGFGYISGVTIDGVPLSGFPLEYEVGPGGTTLNIVNPVAQQLGTVDLTVHSTLGDATVQVEVVAPETPVLRLGEGNDPEGFNSFTPHTIRMGGQPGNVMFLWVSGSDLPTPVPGFFDLDIGNFATNLFYMGAYTVEPKGWTEAQFQFNGLPFFTPIYWQSTEYDPVSMTLPAKVSNVAEGLWTF